MARTDIRVICKNVFKSNDYKTIKETLTQKMIELINQSEKNKCNSKSHQVGRLVFIESEKRR